MRDTLQRLPRRSILRGALVVGVFLVSAGLAGSSPAIQGLQEQLPRTQFRGAVDRVLVDVVVQDGQGRFVPGLTAEDFRVYEEGDEMDISFFALERFREEIPWEGAAEVSEEVREAPVLPRYVVIFIDGYNTPPNHWGLVKHHLTRYLAEGLEPNDRVLVATLTPERRLMVAPEFTRDADALTRVLDDIRTNPEIIARVQDNRRQILELLYSDLDTGSTNDPNNDQSTEATGATIRRTASLANAFAGQRKQEVLYTLDAIVSLAAHLDQSFDVPGPKVMIMVSSGITQNPGSEYFHIINGRLEQLQNQVRSEGLNDNYDPIAFRTAAAETIEEYLLRAVGRLNRLNYMLYTVGARGLNDALPTSVSQQTRSNLSVGMQQVVARDVQEGLRMMARGTGALAFDSSNNFAHAFERIERDTAFRYVLGYSPPDHTEDGEKFYRIRVEVDVPGLEVRARRGYVN